MAIAAAAFCLLCASVAHAQTPTTPTVSTIAVTSNPGTDNTYTTLDVITVTVTFSEAVTVSTTDGTPRLAIDIGGQPRNILYDRAGSSTGQLIFGYTVFAGDMDADGIAVKADGLVLNGGTIKSTDDSTDADLDISAQTFATHKVDTEVVLVSNIGQADAADTITISATESVEATFRIPATDNGFDLHGHRAGREDRVRHAGRDDQRRACRRKRRENCDGPQFHLYRFRSQRRQPGVHPGRPISQAGQYVFCSLGGGVRDLSIQNFD